MKALVTRDSVCAGDDFDPPHARTIAVPATDTTDALVAAVVRAYPLANIRWRECHLVLSSGVPLAVVAQQWAEPKLTFSRKISDCDVHDNVVRLHFSYLAQVDPDLAFEVVGRLRLTSPA